MPFTSLRWVVWCDREAYGGTGRIGHREPLNARILLVILFPRDVAAITVWDSRESWAFNEGTFEAQFSALGG